MWLRRLVHLAVSTLLLAFPGAAAGAAAAQNITTDTTANIAHTAITTAGGDCVTRAEYRRARHGMLKRRVHRIFGTSGWQIYVIIDNEEKRGYPMCNPELRLTVTYLNGALGYKQLRS